MSELTIEVHTICWNEEQLLPLFLSHYEEFATRIVVWDNGSDDSSPDLVRHAPRAQLRFYDSGGMSSEDKILEIKNHCWHGTDADWVIVCDVDELVFHPNLQQELERTSAEILRCDGYNVTGEFVTRRPSLESPVWKGQPTPFYCKPALFRPSIGEIRYTHGCHDANPDKPIVNSLIKILHCQFLRSPEELVARFQQHNARKAPEDVRRGFGHQYRRTEGEIRADHQHVVNESYPFPIIDDVRRRQVSGANSADIAAQLQHDGITPPRRQREWSASLVAQFFGEFTATQTSETGNG